MTDDSSRRNHRQFQGSLYCQNHNATFEQQEAERNDDNCPWCDEGVSEVVY